MIPKPPPSSPLPPPGPIEGLPRPPSFRVGPTSAHGIVATYAKGCRCEHCRYRWTEYRRPREQARTHVRKLEAARALLAAEEASKSETAT